MSERKRRRRFTADFKAEAMERLLESGRPLRDVVGKRELSVGRLSQWRNEQLAAGTAEALALRRADEPELQRLRRECRRQEEEIQILRKAAAFFAKEIVK